MATANSPLEDDIVLFCDITSLPRATAITRLKANNNDLQRATEEYFEDTSSQKYKWDDSQFSMDRQGEANDTEISFNIQGPDELAPNSYQNTAPTRPPSRANNTSPFGAPVNAAEEDANLERALAESAAESGIQLQEVGVVDNETNLKYFGPANRPEYETEQWAMIPTKATTDTVTPVPTPSQRKRDPDAPAFLHQTKYHRVGFMLSIYHKIPLARNIFLQCGTPAKNYGHNSEWWRGQPILTHKHLTAMAKGEMVWGEESHPDFGEELHRLMAFLDKTERAYGTADCIAETKAIDPSLGSWMPDVEDKLFEAIKEECDKNPECDLEPLRTIGTILPCAPPSPDACQPEGDTDSYSEEERDTPFIFLDIQLDDEQYAWVNTLYNAIDHLLWTGALAPQHPFPEGSSYAVLSKAAEVITVRLSGSGLSKPCEMPAVLYLDRYMKDRKDLALQFQTQTRFIMHKVHMCDLLRAHLERCHGRHCHKVNGLESGSHTIFACLTGIIEHTERLMQRQTKTAQWRHYHSQLENGTELSLDDIFGIDTWSRPCTFLPEEEAKMKKWKKVVDGCNKKIEELKAKLDELSNVKEEYLHSIKVISIRLTCLEDEIDDDKFVFRTTPAYYPDYWSPTHKYTLRGVALTEGLAYVCVRQDAESMDVDEAPTTKDQWWKIGYPSNNPTAPDKIEKADLKDVLNAAETGAKFPILIYASEVAMQTKPIPLSDALRMFVRADNRSFQQELAQEQDAEQPPQNLSHPGVSTDYAPNVSVASQGKRKHSIGSSVATQGSSRADLDDVDPFQWETRPDDEHSSTKEAEGLKPSTPTPEMQERTGSSAPFLTWTNQTAQTGPIEMEDIDLDPEVEHHEG